MSGRHSLPWAPTWRGDFRLGLTKPVETLSSGEAACLATGNAMPRDMVNSSFRTPFRQVATLYWDTSLAMIFAGVRDFGHEPVTLSRETLSRITSPSAPCVRSRRHMPGHL